jgi:hypothetical protein
MTNQVDQISIKKSAMDEKVTNESVNNSDEEKSKSKELLTSIKPLKPGQQILND